ncbi:MAG: CaiB/BaiF CoA-transferase family protein [Deltaproteobacteria bacterium]
MSERAVLKGIRVLDLSSVGPASRCSSILADYGATVIKVGPTPARDAVQIQPPFYAYSAGRGLKRVRIDLKADQGKEAFLRLAAGADVIIESFRPGVVDRLGIGYEDIKKVNGAIVYCSTSGYGQNGPYSKWAGHDINYLALGGFLDCSSPRGDGGPPIPGATVADSAAGGMQAATAILAALVGRNADGEGIYLDVSVAEGVLSLMYLHIDKYLATGSRPAPGYDVLTGRYACYDLYPARDGKWLAVGAIEPAFFANLCKALGCEKWISRQNDDDCQQEIRDDFKAAFGQRDRDDWVARLAPADTCVTAVYSVDELVEDEHFIARGAFGEAEDGEHGRFGQVAPVFAGALKPEGPHLVREGSATDTDELLAQAGLAEDDIKRMRDAGVIA